MVLAFSSGDDRDLVDARADQFIRNAAAVRGTAGAWKDALKRHLAPTMASYADFSRRMALEGERRDPYTVRTWATHTNSIAPRNYRVLVPSNRKAHRRFGPSATLAAGAGGHRFDLSRPGAGGRRDRSRNLFRRNRCERRAAVFRTERRRYRLFPPSGARAGGVQEVPIELIGKIGSLNGEPAGSGTKPVLDL